MRDFIYAALAVAGVAATVAAAVYAFEDRGYFAIGSEYAFLFLPAFGWLVECLVEDWREGRRRHA